MAETIIIEGLRTSGLTHKHLNYIAPHKLENTYCAYGDHILTSHNIITHTFMMVGNENDSGTSLVSDCTAMFHWPSFHDRSHTVLSLQHSVHCVQVLILIMFHSYNPLS